ncbi:MAG: hypothetical protein U9O94_06380 [Nanoarchaeota archaeon]|nr:hypothetical protein [Nanoarchaeota archaeon]
MTYKELNNQLKSLDGLVLEKGTIKQKEGWTRVKLALYGHKRLVNDLTVIIRTLENDLLDIDGGKL